MEYWTMENILVKQLDFKNHGNLQNKYGDVWSYHIRNHQLNLGPKLGSGGYIACSCGWAWGPEFV